MDVCTIIAKNYLPAARVLAASLREQHPEAGFHVLVIDDVHGYVDAADEPFELLCPHELGLPRFEVMAGVYTILELSTAVKPWLLRTLLARNGEGAVYLDPDMRIYAPIDEAFTAVREYGLVLNPHNTEPMPRDGRKPNEQDILIAGAYNLGFLGLGATDFSHFLLDWWSERLEMDCIVDPERGFFVDQRWIDLVPGMARDYYVIRDPGFNVAYWNLPTRELAKADGRVTVDGAPLRLFHFSGFKPERPHLLSTHQNRIRLGDEPVLAGLCADYAEALDAAGYPVASTWPYSYARTASGLRLDRTLRAVYREAVEDDRLAGTPFDADGERALLRYALEPADVGARHGVTRYLHALYDARPDLRAAYPDLDDASTAAGYIGWVDLHGRAELGLPDALIGAAVPPPIPSGPPQLADGVNVAGYLNAELGVGEVARQVIAALDSHRVPVMPVGLHAPNSREGHEYAAVGSEAGSRFGINVICVNADGLPRFAREAGKLFFADRYTVGIWWWELAAFPDEWLGSFEHVDEVWAGSAFVADAIAQVAPVPVIPMRLPLTVPDVPPGGGREALGLPDGFVFLFTFDYNSVFKRKNPLGAVEAFTRAFRPGDGVSLVIKSVNHGNDPESRDRLRLAAAAHPHVRLIEDYLSAADKNRLIAACDAYVSLHRSEGFGIGLAEALLLGRPVIATGYGGNTDFVTAETGYVVPYSLVQVGDDAWPYQPDAEWAEPDVDAGAVLMRELVADRAEAEARAARGRELLLARHSVIAAGAQMVERVRVIRQSLPDRPLPEADATAALGEPDPRLRTRIRATAAAARGQGRLGLPGSVARKAVLRGLRPYTAHADAVALELDTGVRRNDENLRAAIARAERARAMDHAQALAENRALRARLERLEAERGLPAGELLAAAGRRIDDLAAQVDRLRAGLGEHARGLARLGVSPAGAEPGPDAYRPAPAAEPWSEAYVQAQAAFVAAELDDPALVERVRAGGRLPDGFGIGYDERVVEYPWLAAQRLGGEVLDAGSTLNHLHVMTRLRARMDGLHVVTLAPEPEAYTQLGVSYLYADLRELPLADAVYDRVLSVSTLEHVGLDLGHFGAASDAAPEPRPELLRAVAELQRVLKPGGDCYITVPVGRPERFAWVRTLSHDEVDELVDAFDPARAAMRYFAYSREGWQVSTREATADARYRDHLTSGPPGPDRRVAAGAVACIHLVRR